MRQSISRQRRQGVHDPTVGRGGSDQTPLPEMAGLISATPPMSLFRIGILVTMSLLTIGAISTLGVLLVNLSKDEVGVGESLVAAHALIDLIRANIAGIPPVPECVTNGTVDIGTTFSSSDFSVYRSTDISSKIRFDLSGLDTNASSDVVLTIREQFSPTDPRGRTIAYLSDIPSTIQTAFSEEKFAIRNSNVPTKRMRFDLDLLWFNAPTQSHTLSVQSVSGTVAFVHNINVFGFFTDDLFAVFNEAESTKQVMFDVGEVPSGSTVTLQIQDSSGTITFVNDTIPDTPPFADDVFKLQHSSDTDARMRFVLDNLVSDTSVILRGRDSSGTIAYLDDAPQIYEVFILSNRSFPHTDFEGVATLSELGSIDFMDISMCGGGGGGGAFISPSVGAGGGSGSGHARFPIRDPLAKFTTFDITIGEGGVGAPLSHGTSGGRTRVLGIGTGDFFFELSGWGGGGGGRGTGLFAKGGCGGGGAGEGTTVNDGPFTTTNTPGRAGGEGGFVGGLGGRVDGQGPDGQPGELASSWRAGGGGGAQNGNGAAWIHGLPPRPCPTGGCGADGMFGLGGTAENPNGIGCSGGGRGPTDETVGGGTGGNGRVLIRYTLG